MAIAYICCQVFIEKGGGGGAGGLGGRRVGAIRERGWRKTNSEQQVNRFSSRTVYNPKKEALMIQKYTD